MPTVTSFATSESTGTFATACVSTFKSVFGSGILAFPFAVMSAGLWPAILGTTVMCGWSFYTANLIARCTSFVPTAHSYDEVCAASLGIAGKWFGAVNLVVHQILVSTAYLTFAAQNFADVCGAPCLSATGSGAYSWRVIACATPLYVAFCLMRDVSVLSPVSAVGNVAVVLCLAVILYDAAPFMAWANLEPVGAEGVRGAASFFGIAAFTFAGQTEVVSIYTSMRDKRVYGSVLACVGVVTFVVFAGFGVLVYAAFGRATHVNVFEDIDGEAALAAKLLMSLVLFLSIPLKMMPAFAVFEQGEGSCCAAEDSYGRQRTGLRATGARLALRALLALAPAAIAIAISDFGFLVEFVGAFSLSIIAFILPPLMYLRLGGASGGRSFVAHAALVVAGVVFSASATWGVLAAKLRESYGGGEMARE